MSQSLSEKKLTDEISKHLSKIDRGIKGLNNEVESIIWESLD